MIVGDDVVGVLAQLLAATHVGVHRPADDRPGPDDRDLDREIREVPRAHATHHLDLGAALDLEEPDRVARADAVEDLLVLVVDPRQIGHLAVPVGDQLDRLLDERQHPEREEVDLDEPRVVAAVLVPLAEDPALPGRRLERNQLHERPARDDHPADVLRDMPGQPPDLPGQLGERAPRRRVELRAELVDPGQLARDPVLSGICQLRELLDVSHREAERFPHLAHDRPRSVGREGADEPDVVVPVPLVHGEDQLFADVAREVDVDVGDAAHRVVEEPSQVEVRLHRVDVRQPDQVADDRRDRRPPTTSGREERARLGPSADLLRDFAREVQDVAVHEEEPGEIVPVDELYLLLEPPLGLGPVGVSARVAHLERGATHLCEHPDRGRAAASHEVGELVAEIAGEIELAAPLGDDERVEDRVGPGLETPRHLVRRREVETGVRTSELVRVFDRRPVADRHEHVLETVTVAVVVVDVPRRDDRNPEPVGERAERLHPRPVAVYRVVLELDVQVSGAEDVDETTEQRLRLARPPIERGENRTPATPREDDEPLGPLEKRLERDARVAALVLHVRARDEPAQVRVPRRGLGEQRHVITRACLVGPSARVDPAPCPVRNGGSRGRRLVFALVGEGR